jgi:hypothetical protein
LFSPNQRLPFNATGQFITALLEAPLRYPYVEALS